MRYGSADPALREIDVARIENDRVLACGERRADASWLFTIRYAVHFDPCELGQRFDDSVAIADASQHPRTAYALPVTFTACSPSVYRKKRVIVPADQLVAGQTSDGLFAWILLRRNGAGASTEDEQRALVTVNAA